jgi:hypothetical protein
MAEPVPYKAIFDDLESTLIRVGDRDRSIDMRQNLNESKNVASKTLTDPDYFRLLVHVTFYSGFKAVTVGAKLPTIDKYFFGLQGGR